MLTVHQMPARVGRDLETARRRIRTGKLRARMVGVQHVVDERELAELLDDDGLLLPRAGKTTSTREPMPNVVDTLRRSRKSR